MLAHVLNQAGREPGFLIGGVPLDFEVSARLGAHDAPFVVEADEYDSAFFDKRSKFIHYRPRTLVINNIEFDHADIFDDLAAIRRQFNHLVRTVPGEGLIVRATPEEDIDRVLALECWTPVESFGLEAGDWTARGMAPDGSAFHVCRGGSVLGRVEWDLVGRHNMMNALAAIAAAHGVGVDPTHAIRALARFRGVKRRLELRACVAGIRVYDDFAHHPPRDRDNARGPAGASRDRPDSRCARPRIEHHASRRAPRRDHTRPLGRRCRLDSTGGGA